MNKLELITTENFSEVKCDFYKDNCNEILLTREQIGNALGYTQGNVAITKIHNRHKDRLDSLSVYTKLEATDGKRYNTCLYTERGVMEICRWSRQPKADEFMDWVWDIVELYRQQLNNKEAYTPDILNNIDNRLAKIEKTITEDKMTYFSDYTTWKDILFKKIALLEYPLRTTRKDILSNLYRKLYTAGYKMSDLKKSFCETHKTNDCYPLDAIQENEGAMNIVDKIIDNVILSRHLLTVEELENLKQENNILNTKGEEINN